jgi:ornithine cyclodeaminase/alanine dehydrogenase-like protein (mu-crystallin family)
MFLLRSSDLERMIADDGLDLFMDRIIEGIEQGFRGYNPRQVNIPARSGFVGSGLIEWMPVSFADQSVVIKVVSYFPDNPVRNNASTIQAYISRSDWRDGRLTDLVEGSLLTAMRTGAASAVASRILARPDSTTLGLVGCGAQSVTQAHAISRCFKIERILAYDTCQQANASIVGRLAFLGIPVYPAALDEVEAAADILCTATSVNVGAGPVISGTRLKPHVHINAVGSDFPGKTEIPLFVLRDAVVIPDHREQAVLEGECQQLGSSGIGPELFELVGDKDAFTHLRNRRTVFDSTGIALEDAIALDIACRLAVETGIGKKIAFAENDIDPKSPYAACLELLDAYPQRAVVLNGNNT